MKLNKQQIQRVNFIGRVLSLSQSEVIHLLTEERFLGAWHERECQDMETGAVEWIETPWGSPGVTKDIPWLRKSYRVRGEYRETSYRLRDTYTPRRDRLVQWCKDRGLYCHIQTDPRGAAVYVSRSPISNSDTSQATACCL